MRAVTVVCAVLAAVAAAQELPWWFDGSNNNNNNNNNNNQQQPQPSDGSATPNPFEESSYEPCVCEPGVSCLCVLYYQCVNDTILTSGADLLDDRFQKPPVESCPGVQRCCREPPPDITDQTPETPTQGTPTPTPGRPTPTPTPRPPPVVTPGPGKSGCGVRRGNSGSADNGTLPAEFPWMMVVLEAKYPVPGQPPIDVFKCGASLIHPQMALTAAHCVDRILPSDLKVRAGEWDLSAESEPEAHQDRRVNTVIKHPGFEPRTLYNDVAVLVLSAPFNQAPNVDVICLPPPNNVDFSGERCLATGWGTPKPDAKVVLTSLKKVELPVVERDDCQQRLRTTRLGRYFRLHQSFICAGGEPGVDTCRGDGGGPLVCPIPDDPGRYIQVGIVSWGIGCGSMNMPAVYASLSFFRDWVDKQLDENGFLNIAEPPPSVVDDARVGAIWGQSQTQG